VSAAPISARSTSTQLFSMTPAHCSSAIHPIFNSHCTIPHSADMLCLELPMLSQTTSYWPGCHAACWTTL